MFIEFSPAYFIIATLVVILGVLFLKPGPKKRQQLPYYFLFTVYLLFVVSLTFFPIPLGTVRQQFYVEPNSYIPLESTIHILSHRFFLTPFEQIVGNIFLFVPLGIFAPMVLRIQKFSSVALTAFFFSAAIETAQMLVSIAIGFRYRTFDVDDIILNVTGALLGLWIWRRAIKSN